MPIFSITKSSEQLQTVYEVMNCCDCRCLCTFPHFLKCLNPRWWNLQRPSHVHPAPRTVPAPRGSAVISMAKICQRAGKVEKGKKTKSNLAANEEAGALTRLRVASGCKSLQRSVRVKAQMWGGGSSPLKVEKYSCVVSVVALV